MTQTPDYDVILVTADAGLSTAMRRHCPPGARFLCVKPEEWDRRPELSAAQVWIDLDQGPRRAGTEYQRCTYLCSDQGSVPRSLATEAVVPKAGAIDEPDALWASVASGGRSSVARCRAENCLPRWLQRLNEIEWSRLLAALGEVLPAQLGYDDFALYVRDAAASAFTLAKTSLRTPIDRTICAGDPIHAIAVAARKRTLRMMDRRAIVPLLDDEACVGVLQLEGAGPDRETDIGYLTRIAEVIGRQVVYARMFERARAEARIDGLTGLFNYRWMREIVHKEVRRAQRYATPLCVLAVDLDNLKQINDSRGHQAGDACLRKIAMTISACLRHIDSAARVGGDEFLVVLPRTNRHGAQRVAERILAETRLGSASASLGVCELSDGWDAERLLEEADRTMYEAKRAGGDRVIVWRRERTAPRSSDLPLPANADLQLDFP